MNRPRVNSDGQKELNKAEEKIGEFKETVREFNPFTGLESVNPADPQTKLSTRELNAMDAPYIKPVRSVNRVNSEKSKTYWNEKFQEQHDNDWKYVKCTVENNELIGQAVECWTAKYGCDPAHFWIVPVNKPIMIPRLLAEQLAKCQYHRLKMEDGSDKVNYVNSNLVADHVVHRIDARPVGFGFS
jgi:hypothetical protein